MRHMVCNVKIIKIKSKLQSIMRWSSTSSYLMLGNPKNAPSCAHDSGPSDFPSYPKILNGYACFAVRLADLHISKRIPLLTLQGSWCCDPNPDPKGNDTFLQRRASDVGPVLPRSYTAILERLDSPARPHHYARTSRISISSPTLICSNGIRVSQRRAPLLPLALARAS